MWQAPGAGHLPLDPSVWPTASVTVADRLALVDHMPTQVLYGERVLVLARRGAGRRSPSPTNRRRSTGAGIPGWVLSWSSARRSRRRTVDDGEDDDARQRNGRGLRLAGPGRSRRRVRDARRCHGRARISSARRSSSSGCTTSGAACRAGATTARGSPGRCIRAHGITIPRDADAQFAAGRPVAMSKLLPGDLLFYEHPVVGHVAMYIGDGKMIESPNSRSEVRIVPVRTSRLRRRAPVLRVRGARARGHRRDPALRDDRPALASPPRHCCRLRGGRAAAPRRVASRRLADAAFRPDVAPRRDAWRRAAAW